MDQTLQDLLDIFRPDGFDWMNFVLTKGNPYTYHHILERYNGGKRSIDNGAILTKRAHRFLNMLQLFYPDAYDDLQNVFRRINGTKEPVTQEFVDEIDEILKKVLITKEYEFKSNKNIVDVGNTTHLVNDDIPNNAFDGHLIWTSSNPNIATVDRYGVIKGIKPGIVNISARTKNGKEVVSEAMEVFDISSFCKEKYNSNRKVKKLTK